MTCWWHFPPPALTTPIHFLLHFVPVLLILDVFSMLPILSEVGKCVPLEVLEFDT